MCNTTYHKDMYFVYIIECTDGSYYTGSTTDVARRFVAHAEGRGARYTRARGVVRVVHSETYATKGEALSRESAIKKLNRSEKEKLVRGG